MGTRTFYECLKVFFSVLSLGLAIVTIWICKNWLDLNEESVLIALILIPGVTYFLSSAVLKSVKYGDLEATLAEPVTKLFDSVENSKIESSVEKVEIIIKEELEELSTRALRSDSSDAFLLALILEGDVRISVDGLQKYLASRNFRFVVFLDRGHKFLGYLPTNKTLQILSAPLLSVQFVNFINNGDTSQLSLFSLNTKAIKEKTKIIDALNEMFENNLRSVIVTDKANKVVGVVERDSLAGKLLLSLIKST